MPTFYPYLNNINIKNLSEEELDTVLLFACAAKADEDLICVEIEGEYADPISISRTGYNLYLFNHGQRLFVHPDTVIDLILTHMG